MKKIKKIIILILAIFIVIFIASSVFIALNGKKIVESEIQQSLKMKASIGSIGLSIPFSVHLSNLEIGDLLRVEKISATPSILGLFAGKIVLSGLTLVNPVINLEQSFDGSLNIPKLEQKEKQPPFYLTGLTIRNGKIIFTDKKIDAQGFKIIIDKINAGISKVMLPPASLNTKFKLSAVLLSPVNKGLGNINLDGWIDFGSKDMDATFELKGLEATYFQANLGDFISNRQLLSAKVNLLSHFRSEKNDLSIDSDFRLSNLVYAQAQAPEEGQDTNMPSIDVFRNALDLFTDKEGNLKLTFTLKTKFDEPQISVRQFKKAILEAALRNLSGQSPESLFEKINKNIEQFEEIGKQFKKIFKNE